MRILATLLPLATAAHVVVYDSAAPSETYPLGTLLLYQLVPPFPTRGDIYINSGRLTTPHYFDSLANLEYRAHDSQRLQYIEAPANGILNAFDAYTITVTAPADPAIPVVSFATSVYLFDVLRPPFANATFIGRPGVPLPFRIEVESYNQLKGEVDGLVSPYAFFDPDTGVIYDGIRFLSPMPPGRIFEADCTTPVSPGYIHRTQDFCVLGATGEFLIELFGRAGSSLGKSLLTFREVDLETSCSYCTFTIPENTTLNLSPIPFTAIGNANFSIRVDTLPHEMDIHFDGVPILLSNGPLPLPTRIELVPQPGLFTAIQFPGEDPLFVRSDGLPIRSCLAIYGPPTAPDERCDERFVFWIEATRPDAERLVFPAQTISVTIIHSISSDQLRACPRCAVRAPDGYSGAFDFELDVSDGRRIPDFYVEVTSLPEHGQLNNGGEEVFLGTVLHSGHLALSFAPYEGTGYFTHFFFPSAPAATLQETDDRGVAAPYFANPDGFTYRVLSSHFAAQPPAEGRVDFHVALHGDLLTACPIVPSNENFMQRDACLAFGLESNTLFGEQFIPIYLDATHDVSRFEILQVPQHGDIFLNTGTFEAPEPSGARIVPTQIINTRDLVYIGHTNYANQRGTVGTNLAGEPMGGCTQLHERMCPDTFRFRACSGEVRLSQPAEFLIYVAALASEPRFFAPEMLHVPGGGPALLPATYSDPDDAEAHAALQIISDDIPFGLTGAAIAKIASRFPDCLRIANCTGQVDLVFIDRDITLAATGILVNVPPESTAEEESIVFLTVTKRPETGVDPGVAFRAAANDIIFVADLVVFADPEDGDAYYFSGCEIDDCEEYFANQNALAAAAHAQRLYGAAIGVPIAVVLLAAFFLYRSFPRASTSVPQKEIRSTAVAPLLRSTRM